MYICGTWEDGIDDLICKAELETQTQRINMWTPGGKGGWDELGIGIDIYTLLCMK